MPKAGTPYPLQVLRRNVSGAAVAGKVEADFTVSALLDDAVVVLTVADFTDIGSGFYALTVDLPTSVGRMRIDVTCANPSTDTADPNVFEGDLTARSLDDVGVLAARPPSISLASNVSPNADYRLEVFAGDGRTLSIPIYDDNGDLLDLTGWENFRFSLQNAGQTTVASTLPYHQTSGITNGADGIAAVAIPENCSAYGALAAGVTSVTVFWSLDANPTGDTAATRTLRAGSFVIRRKETPTP